MSEGERYSVMPKSRSLEDLLLGINDSLKELTRRLEKLESSSGDADKISSLHFVPGPMSSLPEHLRRSMETIVGVGQADAESIAEQTGRSRAAESDYLNQLVDRGFLKKERLGKKIVFQVFELHTVCPACGYRVPINVNYCSRCGAHLKEEPFLVRSKSDRK